MTSENQNNKSNKQFASPASVVDLNEIISNCGVSIYIVQDNKVVFHNPQFLQLLGYNIDEIANINFIDIVHSKDKKLINLLFSDNFREIRQKRSRSYTFRALHKNGDMRWLKSNVSLIKWNGKAALLDNCFDISQQKEFEEKLVEEEQNFRLLVNGFEDMVFIISKRGIIVQANQSVYNRLNYHEHQIVLRNFVGLFSADKRDELRSGISDVFFGKRIKLGTEIINADDKKIPVEIRLFKGNWSQKEVIFAICQDITARLEAEQTIRLSEEKFSKAFENNAVMMTISAFYDGRFMDVNETFLKVTGLKKEQVIGKKSHELNLFSDTNYRTELKESILREGSARDLETVFVTPNGTRLIVNFSMELIDIQEELCLLTIMTDITQKKQDEERIMHSEQRFRQLADLLPEKVFEANDKGYITFANQYLQLFFGYNDQSIQDGLHISNLFGSASKKIITKYLKESKTILELPSIELIARKADGTCFPTLTHITSVVEKGKLNRYMGVMVDISARKQQELELIRAKDEAEEASRAKEQFLSTMSHEIRTPMNAVIGMANIMLQDSPMDYQMDHLRTLKLSAEGLMALLNDILDFSKIGAGKLKIDRSAISLKELAQGVWNVNKHIASKRGIELSLNFDEAIPESVLADGVRLNQVLTNLTSNAIKFTEKGTIKITLKLAKETAKTISVFFSVADTGIGIPLEKQKQIFNEFTQANYQTTRKYGGTGLGLAISQKLITLQKGRIELRSVPGKGSEFYFTLTFTKSNAKLGAPKTDETKTSTIGLKNGEPYRILVVEDNEINSFIVIKFLKGWGIDTTLAENGQVALDILQNDSFDLILMDLEMPVMSGYDATVAIRNLKDSTKNSIPIIALTASAMLDVQHKIFSLGMNGFILKPFNPMDLKTKITELLND
ncbi:MAG: PAS domain S-box protein [Bacteroidales bacterium]|nr:PAS domain S-box protein [Bacteroidales bacterium]